MYEEHADRFWSKVEKTDGCWIWTGAKIPDGYGSFGIDNTQVGAHRVAYELLVGPIPDGLVIDHVCRNRGCVNPAHMETVTGAENNLRGESPSALNARKTHCDHGHEFTPDNTIGAGRQRRCRTCNRAWEARRRERRAEEVLV